jgi:hypothetical protein
MEENINEFIVLGRLFLRRYGGDVIGIITTCNIRSKIIKTVKSKLLII